MPHLTLPISAEGCIIRLDVGITKKHEATLRETNQPIPPMATVDALIDTGSNSTFVDESILKQLGMPPKGIVEIHTPSTKGTPMTFRSYDVFIGLYHPTFSLLKEKVLIIGNDFTGQNINAIIGRDLLKSCLLVYNGNNKTFTLGF